MSWENKQVRWRGKCKGLGVVRQSQSITWLLGHLTICRSTLKLYYLHWFDDQSRPNFYHAVSIYKVLLNLILWAYELCCQHTWWVSIISPPPPLPSSLSPQNSIQQYSQLTRIHSQREYDRHQRSESDLTQRPSSAQAMRGSPTLSHTETCVWIHELYLLPPLSLSSPLPTLYYIIHHSYYYMLWYNNYCLYGVV